MGPSTKYLPTQRLWWDYLKKVSGELKTEARKSDGAIYPCLLVGRDLIRKAKGWQAPPPGKFSQPEKKFRDAHLECFAIYVGQGVFAVGAEAFGDVVLVPGEEADGLANGDKA